MNRRLYITADDLGLESQVTDGIVFCAENALINGAALLVNAPGTEHALGKLASLKDIEVGLHLSFVEGYSFSGKSSLLDNRQYFPGVRPCLNLNWKKFVIRYFTGKINRSDLYEELELQILYFLKHVGPIPFINGTQHLQMLPGIFEMVIELSKKYNIPKIRLSKVGLSELWFSKHRFLSSLALNTCLVRNSFWNTESSIQSMGITYGITSAGQTDKSFIDFVLKESKTKDIELVMHPGFNSNNIKSWIPESYAHFNWEQEIQSLTYLKDKSHDY